MHARQEKCMRQVQVANTVLFCVDFTRHSEQYHLQIYYSEL